VVRGGEGRVRVWSCRGPTAAGRRGSQGGGGRPAVGDGVVRAPPQPRVVRERV
jgi:hypothetical protein